MTPIKLPTKSVLAPVNSKVEVQLNSANGELGTFWIATGNLEEKQTTT